MELYQFQQEDYEKLKTQTAALIGSDMGTGKTPLGLRLEQAWWNKETQRPTLIITPLNTFDGWRNIYKKWAPDTDLYFIDRKNRPAFVKAIRQRKADVFIMHWDALRLMPELTKIQFGTIIGDEVHRVANRKSQVFRALKHLHADHRLGMSGTASGDQPQNLWSVLNWLWPTFYTSYWRFRKHYCIEEKVYVEGQEQGYTKIVGVQNIDSLLKQMSPWYVRHMKRDKCCEHHPHGVMPWLKDKVYDTIWVDLSPKQRKMYEDMRKEMVAWVGDQEDSPMIAGVVVAQMVRLSQMALATPEPYTQTILRRTGDLVGQYEDVQRYKMIDPSSKLDALMELIADHPGKKMVVASSSKQILYLAQARLASLKKPVKSFMLSGDTPQSEREGMAQRFAEDDTQIWLGVIEAMAEGIDGLQYATDTMVFLDRSWKTIKNKQCEDRLDRDGQSEGVQIIDIMARNTVDLGRRTKIDTKWEWIRTILGDKFNNVAVVEGEDAA